MKNICKFSFDIAVAIVLTIPAIPILAVLIPIMAWKTKSWPIITQVRTGERGRFFDMYKLKTMTDDRNAARKLLKDNLRTSKFGEVVRKLRLDELPQVFNIFKRDMSVVGPRPHLMKDDITLNIMRQSVKPGLTSLGKIKGFNGISHAKELRYDRYYIRRNQARSAFQNTACDLKIMAYTPLALWNNRKTAHSMQLAEQNVQTQYKKQTLAA